MWGASKLAWIGHDKPIVVKCGDQIFLKLIITISTNLSRNGIRSRGFSLLIWKILQEDEGICTPPPPKKRSDPR